MKLNVHIKIFFNRNEALGILGIITKKYINQFRIFFIVLPILDV